MIPLVACAPPGSFLWETWRWNLAFCPATARAARAPHPGPLPASGARECIGNSLSGRCRAGSSPGTSQSCNGQWNAKESPSPRLRGEGRGEGIRLTDYQDIRRYRKLPQDKLACELLLARLYTQPLARKGGKFRVKAPCSGSKAIPAWYKIIGKARIQGAADSDPPNVVQGPWKAASYAHGLPIWPGGLDVRTLLGPPHAAAFLSTNFSEVRACFVYGYENHYLGIRCL